MKTVPYIAASAISLALLCACNSGRSDNLTSPSQVVDTSIPGLENRSNLTVTFDKRWDVYNMIGPEIVAMYRDFAEAINPETGVGQVQRFRRK